MGSYKWQAHCIIKIAKTQNKGNRMDQKEFSIVLALARSSMGNPNNAIIHHITRLKNQFEEKGEHERAKSLSLILEADRSIPQPKVILSDT